MLLKIKVIPCSSKNELVGPMTDGTIKIKLTTPPVDGKANEVLIKFLAKHYAVAKSKIKIISGLTNKNKTVELG